MKKQHTRTLDPSRAQVLPSDDPNTVILQIPWADGTQHCAGRKYIIAPDEVAEQIHSENRTLVQGNTEGAPSLRRALGKAFLWRKEIESGKYAGVRELANKHKLDESYVLRQLHLTLLAPSIIEQILDNTLPRPIRLDVLCKIARIECWKEQEKALSRL